MYKLLTILLFLKIFTYNASAQHIKEGVFNHPVLGNVELKKIHNKDEDADFYTYEGKGNYNHKKYGKVDYEIVYFDEGFAYWKDVYLHPAYGEVTIFRDPGYSRRTYLNQEGKMVQRDINYHEKDTTNIQKISNYVGGKKEGKQYLYYPNGVLKAEESYVNGNEVGLFKKYYNNGQLQEEKTFDTDGRLDGKYATYKENGEIVIERKHLNGKRMGKWETTDFSDDRLFEFRSKCTYAKDSAYCKEKGYYIKGNILFSIINYKKVNKYNKHLRLESADKYDEDDYDHINHGLYKYWYDGILVEEGIYNNNNKVGEWKTYYRNGNLKTKSNYIIVKNGPGENESSLKHGTWEKYDEDGKQTQTIRFYKDEVIENIIHY